jgi:hypothetical protein
MVGWPAFTADVMSQYTHKLIATVKIVGVSLATFGVLCSAIWNLIGLGDLAAK